MPDQKHIDADEAIAKVLSRFTVLDLTEQTDGSLEDAEAKFTKSQHKEIRVLARGENNLIKWWKVRSGEGEYEVRRFENFIFCSCKDFFFTKKTCKHAFVTTKAFNTLRGKQIDAAPYNPAEPPYKQIKVGNISI